jgi:hypothetical protein
MPAPLPYQNLYLRDADFVETPVFRTLRAQPLGLVDIGRRRCYHEIADPLAAVCAVLAFEPDDELAFKLQSIELSEGAEWAQFAIEQSLAGESVGGLDRVFYIQRGGQLYWGEVMRFDDSVGNLTTVLQTALTTLRQRTVCVLLSAGPTVARLSEILTPLGFEGHGTWDARRRQSERFAEGIDKIDAPHELAVFMKTQSDRPLERRSQHALFAACLLLERHALACEVAARTWAADEGERDRVGRMLARLEAAA